MAVLSTFTGIDHVGIVVQDLTGTAQRLKDLGFTVSELLVHTAMGVDGQEHPVGAGQIDVVFEQGALEIMGVIDPQVAETLAALPNPYQGVNIIAFGTDDIHAAREEIDQRGLYVDVPHPKRRRVNDGNDDRFAYLEFIGLPTDQTTEGYLIVVQQMTPARMRPASLKSHPNTAVALRGITLGAAYPQQTIDRYSRYFGLPLAMRQDLTLTLNGQFIHVREEKSLSEPALVRELTIETRSGTPITVPLTPVLDLRLTSQ